jgi:hypothetical protein
LASLVFTAAFENSSFAPTKPVLDDGLDEDFDDDAIFKLHYVS